MAQLQTTGVTGSLTVTGNITAQTLVVQQVTSSVLVVTGSTKFGSLTSNVQEFTGSLRVTGSGPHYIIGGNVGIGTSSPNHMLDILTDKTGNGAGSTIRLNRPNNASFENAINWATNGTSTWFLGSDNDSTDNFYLYNWLRGAFELTVLSGSGNVGIGTTAPGYKLSVIGGLVTAGTTATQLAFLGADGSNVAYVGSLTNHPFQIRVNNSTRVTIDTNGNVGIGSVTPGATLDVNGNVRATSFTGSFSGSITTSVGSNTQVIYNNAGVLAGSNNFTFNGTNVGIGTTSPGAKLEVFNGDIWLNAASAAVNPEIRFIDDSGIGVAGAKIRYGNGDGNLYIEHVYNEVTSGIFFRNKTSGTALNTLSLVNGNVGIGTTNPIGELQIGSSWTANPGGGNTIWLGTSGVANSNIAPDLIITSNTSATTPGGTIGLALHNSNTTAGAFSPLLVFSKTETGASPFNAAIAAIGARTVTGTGASDSYIDGDLIFYTSPTAGSGLVERLRIIQDGNVGIGTTSPTDFLHLYASGNDKFLKIENTNSYTGIWLQDSGANNGWLLMSGYTNVTSPGDFSIREYGVQTSLTIKSGSGNIGIGTVTPGSKLTVIGDIATSTRVASDTINGYTGGGTPLTVQTGGAQNLILGTNNTTRVLINTDGNIGIGTTTPFRQLTFGTQNNDAVLIRRLTTGEGAPSVGTGIAWTWSSSGTDNQTWAAIRVIMPGNSNTNMTFSTTPVGGEGAGLLERMRIADTGNVGINTTNPSVGKLQINTGAASNNAVTIQATSQTSITYGIGIDASSNLAIYDNFNSAQRITLNGNGNIGIGTTTPAAKFEIKSSAANNLGGLLLRATSTSNFPAVLYENSSNGGTLDLYNGASLTTRINSNGDSYFNGGNVGIGTTVTSYNLDILSTTTGMLRIRGVGQGYTQASVILQTAASADSPEARGLGIYAFNEGKDANWYFGTPYGSAYADSFVVNRKTGSAFEVSAADPLDAINFLIINSAGNIGIGTTGPTTKLQVAGAVSASLFQLGPTQFAARRYSNTVENITTGSYTTLFNVYGDALSSAIRIVVRGTANSVVIDSIIDITANHSEDIVIKSHSGIYTILTIKVLAAGTNTEDFTVQAKISGHEPGQPLQAYVDVYPYGNEIIEFSPGSIYSVTVLEHICTPGFNHSSIGGTSYFNINNGNVGIGTTTPATKLELQGNGSVLRLSTTSAPTTYYFDIESNYDSANTINFYGTAGNNFLKYIYNDNQLLLNPNGGRVGIGTTAAIGTLQVHGTLSISNNAVIGQGSTYGTPSAGSFSTLKLYDSSTGNTDLNNQTYDIQLLTAGSTKLIVKNNGRVGIGTTDPNTTLQVVGNARIGAISSTPANYSIDITAGGTANNAFVDFGYYNTFDAAIWFAGYFGDDSGKFKIRDASSGTTTDRLSIGLGTGVVTINNLAGTGDRIVGANSSGVLSAITVGSGLSLSGGTLTATGGSAGTVTGTGASSEMAYWTSTSNITGSSGFVYDATNGRVGINIASPTQRLDVRGTTYINNGVSTGAGEALIVEGSGDVRLTNGGSIFWGAYSYAASTYIQAYDDQDGIYFYSNGTFSTVMRSSGVGIGVSPPTAYLDVRGAQDTAGLISLQLRAGNSAANFSSNQITFGYNNTDTYRHAIKSRHNSSAASGNSIDFYTWKQGTDSSAAIGTQHVMSIDGLNVGIGITNPASKFHIVNSDSGADGLEYQRWSYTAASVSNYSLILKQTVTANVVRYNFSMINNGTAFNNVLVLDRGKVGIGTTDPVYKLETITDGTLGFRLQTATSTVGNPQIDLYDSGRTQETVISSTDGTTTGTYIASYSNHPLLLGTYAGSSPTARVAISTGGYVGIGTVSPLTNLQIKNNVSAGGFANFTDYQIILWATTTPAASYGFGIESNTLMYHSANTHRFYIANSAIGALTSAGFQVRYRPQVNTQTSTTTLTPDVSESTWHVTALSTSLTIASPSGTANNGERLIIRITDNGTPQSLTFNSIYRAGTDVSLPTITTANKTIYLGFIYNSTNTKWDLVAKVNGI